MVRLPGRLAALALAVLLALALPLACGGGGSPSDPVAVSPETLEGYWVEVGTNSPWPTPMHLHFGVETFPGEAPPGLPTVELDGLFVAGYTLSQGLLQAHNAAGDRLLTAQVVSLTGDTLVIDYGLHQHTFARVDGCNGPHMWFVPYPQHTNTIDAKPPQVTVRDAAFGPDGALHMIASAVGGYQDAYAVIPPGRCTPWVPKLGPRGQSVDVGPDGRVWVVASRDQGELRVYDIPPAPWQRAELDMDDWVTEEPAMISNAPPPTRVIADEDGEPLVLWAYGGMLHTTRRTADGFQRASMDLRSNSSMTPTGLNTKPLPGGDVLIRAGNAHGGVVYHREGAAAGTWSDWSADVLPGGDGTVLGGRATSFDVAPDGTLYAAWSVGEEATAVLTLGRRAPGGDWETLPVGRGVPWDLRVRSDGAVDIVGAMMRLGGDALIWTHVPSGFAPSTWHQSYLPEGGGAVAQVGGGVLSVNARFGPSGEIFMGLPLTTPAWTRPDGGHYAKRLYQEVTLTFSTSAVTRVDFPTVDLSCDSDCTLLMPVGAVVPVHLLTASPDSVRLVGTPSWPLGGPPLPDGVAWLATIPMTKASTDPSAPRAPLALEVADIPAP